MNDAISVTLFRIASELVGGDLVLSDVPYACANFCIVFTLSCGIGYLFGLLSAIIFKCVRTTKLSIFSLFHYFTTSKTIYRSILKAIEL